MMRSIHRWLPGYIASLGRRPAAGIAGPRHLVFCVADHFEPYWNGATRAAALRRVRRWADEYPAFAAAYRDADGRGPRHTIFYPQEQYDDEFLRLLAEPCACGHAEVEIHLHHRNDTAEGLREKLTAFRDTLRDRHGLLGTDAHGRARYGFVHGNWALCNSRPDGDWCGVNEELRVLGETGCYADFTFPSAPSPTQPRMVNAIYRATDTPGRPRACDRGRPVTACPAGRQGGAPDRPAQEPVLPASFLLVTGPLGLDWRARKWGILPRLENGAISAANPPTPARIDLWARQHIHVGGRPDWVFVKVHTHGCVEANADALPGDAMRRAHEHLQQRYNDGAAWRLHYVAAREMYNIVRAAEDGRDGEPGQYRDYEIRPPTVR